MPNHSRMQDIWAAGGVARGNREGALEAERRQQRFKGGEACPEGCGSTIAYEVGKDPKDSVKRHTSDPKACRNHPAHKAKAKPKK